MDEKRERRLGIAWAAVLLTSLVLIIVGGYASAFGWRPGALLLIAALAIRTFANLTVGLTMYRATMTRPWPEVAPIDDDES